MEKNLDGKLARGKISVTLFCGLSGRLVLYKEIPMLIIISIF